MLWFTCCSFCGAYICVISLCNLSSIWGKKRRRKEKKMQTKQKHKCSQDLSWDCHCATLKGKQKRSLIQTESPEGSTTARAERMKGRGWIYTVPCLLSTVFVKCGVFCQNFWPPLTLAQKIAFRQRKKKAWERRMNGGLPKAKNTSSGCNHFYRGENFTHKGEWGERLWKLCGK